MCAWIWSDEAEGNSEATAQVSLRVVSIAAVVIILVIASARISHLKQKNDLQDLRREFRRVIEEMDRKEFVPHNPILHPPSDRRASNPFALPGPNDRHDAFRRPPTEPTQSQIEKSTADTQEKRETK